MERLLQDEISDENDDNGTSSGSVPKAKFDELQTLFAETVERLTSRLRGWRKVVGDTAPAVSAVVIQGWRERGHRTTEE